MHARVTSIRGMFTVVNSDIDDGANRVPTANHECSLIIIKPKK